MNNNRLFILDHQDPLMPYLRGINETSTKTYATRTILFLQDNGTLKPLAIELSLPHPDGDQAGSISTVHTPAGLQGAKATIWLLAKAYANVNDSVYHQLVCNWGLAVEDSSCRHGVRLLIEDYPFAVDGLEVWSAIKSWVKDYVFVYYKNDQEVHQDQEIQNWWDEVRTKGHGDKKHEPWWPKMQTRDELIQSCTIIIWVASALHAAVNFGQYAYGGYLPNRPATSRRLIPEPGTADYNELESQPEKAFLKTVTAQLQSILGISLIEILSRHSADEVFLGERDTPEWTTEKEALDAFDRFGADLRRIERKIEEMNLDVKLRNRTGPVQMPYTLLYPRHLI